MVDRSWARSPLLTGLFPLLACAVACSSTDGADGSDAGDAGDAASDATADTGLTDATLPQGASCLDYSAERNPYFGDTHVHTVLSLDANLQGTRLRPADAYRFAQGEEIEIQPYDADGKGQRTLKIDRPLDFAVVTDHAEFLGHVVSCTDDEFPAYTSAECQSFRDTPSSAFISFNITTAAPRSLAESPSPCAGGACADAISAGWKEVRDAAEEANDTSSACEFTSFVGYEWTSNPGTRNLHRNVIFASDTVPDVPASYFDVTYVQDLWDSLQTECLDVDGCDVLTIPHNSNISNGLMFDGLQKDGEPADAEYVATRAKMEPLVEIFQHKGNSECLSPMGADEQCDFEQMPYATLTTASLGGDPQPPPPGDFVRAALLEGMKLERDLGTNPYAYGFVASTDTHMAAPGAVDEETFPGHGGAGSNTRDELPPGLADNAWFNPGGLAVLWANENSRSSLFEAMRRREAYATSGPRMEVRFFGSWEAEDDLCDGTSFVADGYAGGVPMGANLPERTADGVPHFAVRAQRDPGTEERPGGLLQSIEVIKGWLDGDELKTEVITVAGDPESGASVDTNTCEPEGEGADSLCAVWSDPDFDPEQAAFYYVRVLENPSCRWTGYACNRGGVDCDDPATIGEGFEECCGDYPKTQQERAWTSPIWYRP